MHKHKEKIIKLLTDSNLPGNIKRMIMIQFAIRSKEELDCLVNRIVDYMSPFYALRQLEQKNRTAGIMKREELEMDQLLETKINEYILEINELWSDRLEAEQLFYNDK